MNRPVVVVLGPDRAAISGVSTHVNLLFGSALPEDFELVHFQVGSEGRKEGALGKLARFVTSPLALAAAIVRHDAEVVVDGATGFLVGAGDTKSLRRALERLLADRALARRMGDAARQAVQSRFDANKALSVVEDLYESLGVSIIAERASRIQPVPLKKAA